MHLHAQIDIIFLNEIYFEIFLHHVSVYYIYISREKKHK
jgi:hypothetical protein